MKKALLLLSLPLVFFFTLSAQITQNEADSIVIERINGIAQHCDILYAKEELQTEGVTITTATGEELELDYSCWVYYMNYAGETNNKYLIVKESNGNLLEINTTNDERPNDLEVWRVITREILFDVPREALFEDYLLDYGEPPFSRICWENTYNSSELIIINSSEELEQYVTCTDYPEVDFSEHTLLLARGGHNYWSLLTYDGISLQQLSTHNYIMNINIKEVPLSMQNRWVIPIVVSKITDCDSVELIVTYIYPW